jgi:hypothetical protein
MGHWANSSSHLGTQFPYHKQGNAILGPIPYSHHED